jgi:hypothetical protein
MPDYSNGKIYKLWSPQGEEIYIGSTVNTLPKRKAEHKQMVCSSKILFEKYDDVRIELIEEYPCKNKMQLNKREGYYIRNNECVNKVIPERTKEEWYQDNKEVCNQKSKEYKEDNKEKIRERRTEMITCVCGCEFQRMELARHNRTKKHINFIQQQQASEQ